MSLGAIVLILGVTTIASLIKTRSDNKKDAAAGISRDGDGNVIEATEPTDAATPPQAGVVADEPDGTVHDGSPERAPKA